jgi:hypothetical protein
MTDFVELKRLSAGQNATLQKLWTRRIAQNDRVLGSETSNILVENKWAIWTRKGNPQKKYRWLCDVLALTDWSVELEMGSGIVLVRLPREF